MKPSSKPLTLHKILIENKQTESACITLMNYAFEKYIQYIKLLYWTPNMVLIPLVPTAYLAESTAWDRASVRPFHSQPIEVCVSWSRGFAVRISPETKVEINL